jgi:hypothetical protein
MGSHLLKRSNWIALAGAMVLAFAAPAEAHHSFALYDRTKTIVREGSIVSYSWLNPHVYVDVAFADDDGRTWSLEATAIPMLTRLGWTAKTLHKGDKVTVKYAPLKNGERGGALSEVTLADGKVLNTGMPLQ